MPRRRLMGKGGRYPVDSGGADRHLDAFGTLRHSRLDPFHRWPVRNAAQQGLRPCAFGNQFPFRLNRQGFIDVQQRAEGAFRASGKTGGQIR